jgi:hypothetical protein
MAATNSAIPEPRRFSIRLPRPLWIGLATVVLVVTAFVVYWLGKPVVPRFRNATLCLSRESGHEFAWAGLQDPHDPPAIQVNDFKFVDKDGGTKIQIKWRLLGSSAGGDSYEFKITTGANLIPMVKQISISTEPVELLRTGDIIVTIKDKVFE